jgi:lysophospholipase L1-like esterase
MNEFVKRNIFLTIFVLVVCVFLIFYFVLNKDDYTNYPSNGTDIVAFGDSLIQGVGASSSNKNLVSILKKIGKPIVNLGVSGNTTADGISR